MSSKEQVKGAFIMPEGPFSRQVIEDHNLTLEEYERICRLLGRDPNWVELGMFSALWSEHCSYKSSKVHLRRLPTKAPWVIQGPGENAGVIDIGDGLAVAFKIESHNHPSYVEPFQGAATGVGGILRDVFAMGARPIALMDALRFGPLNEARNRLIMRGVVAGIAHYGNCVGVPTVGGDVYFEPCYAHNPLVNVFCLGVARHENLHFARPRASGRAILYLGAETGRDGIHGANILASRSFDAAAEEKRPSVQIGDPFLEKILLEASLELMRAGLVEALQDMGAAGLTSSSAEMAARGNLGVELDLDLIPLREPGLTPYEIMLSESQERMLVVLKEGVERQAEAILRKWEIPHCIIGRLTDDGMMRLHWKGRVVAEVPVHALTENAPVYDRPQKPYKVQGQTRIPWSEPRSFNRILRRWVVSADFASRSWIYRQYDHTVRANTVRVPGHDAAVLRIKGTRKGIAISVDGNGRMCYLQPYMGARMAVAEAARNVTMMGARPMAVTNCLNFGSPENPPVMYQFARVIEGMAEACEHLETPVVSGNVSFYNETDGKPIYPTPIIGMVGLIEDLDRPIPAGHFMHKGDRVFLAGRIYPNLSGSTYARDHGTLLFDPITFDMEFEKHFQKCIRRAIEEGIVRSAHDISDGGLAWALLEMALGSPEGLGAELHVKIERVRPDIFFFSEIASACILAVQSRDTLRLEKLLEQAGVPYQYLGEVQEQERLSVLVNGGRAIDLSLRPLRKLWLHAFESLLELGGSMPESR